MIALEKLRVRSSTDAETRAPAAALLYRVTGVLMIKPYVLLLIVASNVVVSLAFAQSKLAHTLPHLNSSNAPVSEFAYIPNGTTDTVSAFRIDGTTGALQEIQGSPFLAGSRPIAAATDPKGRFLYVADLVSFQISAYRISKKTGALSEIAGSPFDAGDNPQFVAVDP